MTFCLCLNHEVLTLRVRRYRHKMFIFQMWHRLRRRIVSNLKFFQIIFVILIAVCFISIALNNDSRNFVGFQQDNADLDIRVVHALTASRDNSSRQLQKSGFRRYNVDNNLLERENGKLLRAVSRSLGNSISQIKERMTLNVPRWNMDKIRIHTLDNEILNIDKLHSMIQENDFRVPNAVHYVLPFTKPKLRFHHLICILSGFWIIRPKALILWYNEMPSGKYWNYFLKNITQYRNSIIMINRAPPTNIYGNRVYRREHQSDIIRMEGLLTFGGIYFDIDVLNLKPFDNLRNFPFSVGRETPSGLCNGIMVSQPNSTFLSLWHLTYQTFYGSNWALHSVRMPHELSLEFPELVHVEPFSMNRPNWKDGELIWLYGPERVWDWQRRNYCVHLWYRYNGREYDFESIKGVDSMFGDMFRWVLYGREKVMIESTDMGLWVLLKTSWLS